jgi:hypothetical protein
VDTVFSFLVEDGWIAAMYVIRNPAKLTRLEEPVTLTR